MVPRMPLSFIPSPPINGFHVGPLFIHFYGLMYVIGITLAVLITQRRVRAYGGDPSIVSDVAIWAVPAGIIGGRIYFDVTTPSQIYPHAWWGAFAVWNGGLGIWGGVALGALAGVWRLRRRGVPFGPFADAVAPALLVAQAIGRVGNYFNQELFGKPTTVPWALVISAGHRPPGFAGFRTFQPTFLYELIFDLALAAVLVWLGHHTKIKAPGLFALYVTGYSAFRIFEESLRIDYSEHFLGLRLNTFVATILMIVGIIWFIGSQRRRPDQPPPQPSAPDSPAEAAESESPDPADAAGGPDEPDDRGAAADRIEDTAPAESASADAERG
jgi:prolipoprotein diacylglyceryl transferase